MNIYHPFTVYRDLSCEGNCLPQNHISHTHNVGDLTSNAEMKNDDAKRQSLRVSSIRKFAVRKNVL